MAFHTTACFVGTRLYDGILPVQAPPLSEAEQKARDKTLSFARKELKRLGKAGLAEIKRMAEEEKVRTCFPFTLLELLTALLVLGSIAWRMHALFALCVWITSPQNASRILLRLYIELTHTLFCRCNA